MTIITVVYNSVNFIEKTLKSVMNQDYNNLEYIVIDGDSNDGTLDVIKQYKEHITILISEKDNGIYDAMNKGLLYATGEWIFFLNSGDFFAGNHVLEDIFSKDLEYYDIVYGYISLLNGKTVYPPKKINSFMFMLENTINHQSIFCRKKCFSINFNTNYKVVADRDWLFQNYRGGVKFKYVPVHIVLYEKTGISSDFFKIKNDSLRWIKNNFNIIIYIVVCLRYLGALIKHIILSYL